MKLNTEQGAAAHTTERNVLVLAGPGSGKTRTLIARARWLHEKCPNDRIVMITYTNSAANEMRDRLKDDIPEGQLIIGTIHAFCIRLLKGCKQWAHSIIDEATQVEMLEKAICNSNVTGVSKAKIQEELDKGQFKSRPGGTKPEKIAKHYFALMKRERLMDYDMILHAAGNLAEVGLRQGNPVEVGHILVDEVQDCGVQEHHLFRNLAAQSRFYVGDPNQSIFQWRGAKPHLLDDLDFQRMELPSNYRCGARICQSANRLIEGRNKGVMTNSVTPYEGQVAMIHAIPDEDGECRAISKLVQDMGAENRYAVLLRTNALVEEYTEKLSGGCNVHRPERVKLPHDYEPMLSALSLIEDPGSNFHALRLLTYLEGGKRAQEIAKAAPTNLRSIWREAWDGKLFDYQFIQGLCNWSKEIKDMIRFAYQDLGDRAEPVELIGHLMQAATDQTNSSQPGQVEVMTYHRAKGREWDVVFMPAFEQKILYKGDPTDEDYRMIYVGLTRAKTSVILTYVNSRMNKWTRRREPSKSDPMSFRIVSPSE